MREEKLALSKKWPKCTMLTFTTTQPYLFFLSPTEPDMSPMYVEAWPSQSDSIKIYWSPIPESHRNGIILGYRIFYKAVDVPQRRYDRAPRSVNQYAIYGALPGEKMVETNRSSNSFEIKGLKDYSWYQVRIGAFTSKGLGVMFAINGTAKQESKLRVYCWHCLHCLTYHLVEIIFKV